MGNDNLQKRQKVRKALITGSFILFPLTMNYLSPALVVMGASKGIVTGSLIFFTMLFCSSLVMGRGFCGWLCPGAGVQEPLRKVRGRRVKVNWKEYIKIVLIWIPWIYFIVRGFLTAGGIYSVEPLYLTEYGISVKDMAGIIRCASVALLIVLIALITGRRGFCHYSCWMAPFMITGTWIREKLRIPGLRLRADEAACIDCGKCSSECWMSLNVNEMVKKESMYHHECILCGVCVDTCPTGTIRYIMGTEKK